MSARTIRIPLVHCNAMPDGLSAPPCMTQVPVPADVTTIRAMRAHLRTLGWHYRAPDNDICPACWTAGHR